MNPFDIFVVKVKAFLHNAENGFKDVLAEFLPKAEATVEVALEDIAEIAGKAVLAEAKSLISGKEKFGSAVASVIQQVEIGGKQVALQTAQTAVQVAYITIADVAKNGSN